MKTFKIAHLYYDLMNLYGENGNTRYLVHQLEEQNIKIELHFLTLEDTIDFNKYDFYYIGMGSEQNQSLVLDNLLKYKEDIKEAIENNKYFLLTGNSLELLGKSIHNIDGSFKEALNIFNFKCMAKKERIVGEQLFETELIKEKIIGFQNRQRSLNPLENPLFKVIKGNGSNSKTENEGIQYKNLFATYLLGPLLVRNPYFTEYLIKNICNNLNIKYKNIDDNSLSVKAYNEYIKNFHENE